MTVLYRGLSVSCLLFLLWYPWLAPFLYSTLGSCSAVIAGYTNMFSSHDCTFLKTRMLLPKLLLWKNSGVRLFWRKLVSFAAKLHHLIRIWVQQPGLSWVPDHSYSVGPTDKCYSLQELSYQKQMPGFWGLKYVEDILYRSNSQFSQRQRYSLIGPSQDLYFATIFVSNMNFF